MTKRLKSALLIIMFFSWTSAGAQEHDAHTEGHDVGNESAHADGAHGSADAHHEGGGHGHHKNFLGLFTGFTLENRRDRAFTFGIDYNRWLTDSWGLGVGVERAFGDLDFTIYTVPVSYRTGDWKFFAGPGWEEADGHHGDDHSTGARSGGGVEGGSTEFLVRVGVEYIYNYGTHEVAPKLMADVIDGEVVIVLGVGFGFGF